MKYIFIVPVVYFCDMMPLPGIPSLIGILQHNNIESKYLNLNTKYLEFLNTEKITAYSELLKSFYKNEEYLKYPECFKEVFKNKRITFLKYYFWLKKNIKYFEIFKKLYQLSKCMYSICLFSVIVHTLMNIKNQSAILYCSEIYNYPYSSRNIDIDALLYLFNSRLNNLKDFYQKKVNEIIKDRVDIIGIQISRSSGLISGLLLGYMIKRADRHIHVNIGGNYFESHYKNITNLKDFFGIFFDSISIGDISNKYIFSQGIYLYIAKYGKLRFKIVNIIKDIRNTKYKKIR